MDTTPTLDSDSNATITMNAHTATPVLFELARMGHTVTRDEQGHYIIEAAADRAGKWGEISEADFQAAEAAAETWGPEHTCERPEPTGGYAYYPAPGATSYYP